MRRPTLTAITIAITVTLLAGCAPTPEQPPERVETAWSFPANIVGQPVVNGDTIVAYTHDDTQLQMTAWNLRTGEQRWSSASLPVVTLAEPVQAEVVTLGDTAYTAFFAAEAHQLVLRGADIATGETVDFSGPLHSIRSSLRTCDDMFCFDGVFGDVTATRQLIFDPRTGEVTVDDDAIVFRSATRLSGDLVAGVSHATGGRPHLQLKTGAAEVWSRSLSDVFGEGATLTGASWWWATDRDPIVGYGSVALAGHPSSTTDDNGSLTVDLSDDTRQAIVGLDRETGETVWSIPGAELCHNHVETDASVEIVPVCRYTAGTRAFVRDEEGNSSSHYSDASLEVLSIDTRTGDIVWQTAVDNLRMSAEGHRHRAEDGHLAVLTDEGIITVDIEDGTTRTPAEDEHFVCLTERFLELDAFGEVHNYNAGATAQICNHMGEPDDTLSPRVARTAGTATDDGHWVMWMSNTLSLQHITRDEPLP